MVDGKGRIPVVGGTYVKRLVLVLLMILAAWRDAEERRSEQEVEEWRD